MSFFEGGRKTINQTTNIQNRQVAIQGSNNVGISGGQLTAGRDINFVTTDAGAVQGMRDVSVAAINASQRYVEFAAESNRVAQSNVGNVIDAARTVAGVGMTPEQIAADKGGSKANYVTPVIIGAVVIFGLIIAIKKLK